jgi:ribosomal protein S18 acetylase RimI-like enzyme
VFGLGGARQVTATMDVVEKRHPHTPHYYLQAIGTDTAKQGKGYGGVVIRRHLAVADAARVPCYLESSKDTNIPIYKSFGFEVTGEIQLPNGPTLWPMWRDART